MRLWRKHPDLCVIGTLLAGLFAFQHGEAALAAVGPRFLAVKSAVTARLAAFTAIGDGVPAEDVAIAAGDVVPEAGGLNPAAPTDGANSLTPGAIQDSRGAVFGPAAQFPFSPVCSEPGHYGYSR